MRWFVLGAVFLATLITALVVQAPARLAFNAVAPTARLDAGLVQGTVWDAHLLRLHVGGLVFAEAEASLAPASVLGGAPRLEFTLTDPQARLSGVAVARDGVTLRDVSGVVQLGLIPGLGGGALPADGVVRLEAVSVQFDREGRCVSADGRGVTPVLADLGVRYGAELPVLALALRCEAGLVTVDVTGNAPALSVTGVVTLAAPAPRWRFEARAGDETLASVLTALGFEQAGETYRVRSAGG